MARRAARAVSLLAHPCLTDAQLRQLHVHLLTSSVLSDAFLPNALLRSHLPDSPVSTLLLFPRLRRILPSFLPNNYTFSFLLHAAASLPSPRPHFTASLHALAVLLAQASHAYVANGLIHAYASHGLLASAHQVFDESACRDICSWTSLVTGYARAGRVDDARAVFDGTPERNTVSWSAMVSGYVGAGRFVEAVEVFEGMMRAGVRPNRAALVGVLAACGALGTLEQGRWVHAFVAGKGMAGVDGMVATSLVDMYAKCGCLETARQVFAAMAHRDVFAYTAMISGLSDHGRCSEAIDLFGQMQMEGVWPNEVTFICVLSACGRAGIVDRGREIFRSMAEVYGIVPGVEHYGSLVDVLGRAGLLAEAMDVVRTMPMKPDSYVLGALLNACRLHGDIELAKQVVELLAELGLDHSGVHVQLSNMYACSSKWEDVLDVRKKMEEKNVMKVPGCSVVEVDGVTSEFVADDRSHPWMREIMSAVRELDGQLRLSGHDCYLQDFARQYEYSGS